MIRSIARMSKDTRLFTREEVKEHDKNFDTNLFIINNKVYDVNKFLNDHPGGEEVLAEQRGRDASEPFGDVGHSKDALELMENYLIGEIVESERSEVNENDKFLWQQDKKSNAGQNQDPDSSTTSFPYVLIIVAIIAVIVASNFGIFT